MPDSTVPHLAAARPARTAQSPRSPRREQAQAARTLSEIVLRDFFKEKQPEAALERAAPVTGK